MFDEVLRGETKNPFDDLIKGTILGSESFAKWVRNKFILSKDNYREIGEIKLEISDIDMPLIHPFD